MPSVVCDVHPDEHLELTSVVVVKFARTPHHKPCFRCPEPGCKRHFSIFEGYFEVAGDRSLVRTGHQLWCRKHAIAIAMCVDSVYEGVVTWACPDKECSGRHVASVSELRPSAA
jgi:hypothetical protein